MYLVLRPDTVQYESITGINLQRIATQIAADNADNLPLNSVQHAVDYLRYLGWKVGTC